MFLYDNDTVAFDYNQKVVKVDNMMYHVVHDNHWLNLTLNKISNYVLFSYHLKRCVCENSMFLPIGEKVLLIADLVPIMSIS